MRRGSVHTLGRFSQCVAKISDPILKWLHLHLFFKVDDQKFMDEGDVVAGVVSVPHRQENQSSSLAVEAIVEEPESLIHVGHDPGIGVNVEAVNQLEVT